MSMNANSLRSKPATVEKYNKVKELIAGGLSIQAAIEKMHLGHSAYYTLRATDPERLKGKPGGAGSPKLKRAYTKKALPKMNMLEVPHDPEPSSDNLISGFFFTGTVSQFKALMAGVQDGRL